MKNSKKIATLIITATMIACGSAGKEEKKSTSTTQESKNIATEKEDSNQEEIIEEKEVVEITVVAMGEDMSAIQFEPKSLSVPANSIIKLTLKNESSAAGMLHNFVLVELGSGQEIASAGIKAGKENDFIPNDDRVIAYTALSNMGETVTVEFETPAKGSYHYICTYPGHTNMIGRLNVE